MSSAMRDEAKWHESTKEVGFGFEEIGRSESETKRNENSEFCGTQDSEIGYRAGDRSGSQEGCFVDFLAEELQLSDKILNT